MNWFQIKKTALVTSVTTVLLASPVFAVPPPAGAANVVNPRTGQPVATVVVPEPAIENSESIVPLGSAVDRVTGREVQGFAIIHYKEGYAKPGGGAKDPTSSCYGFLAKGAKWKVAEPYVVASDVDALAVARDLETWDSQVAFDIFGDQDMTSVVDGADTVAPDGKNEVMWGDVSTAGAIAVTIVWGVFYGQTDARYLAEWDAVFDNVDFVWGDATVNPSVMDFENIATHEFGHAAGLADLYTSQCFEQTMYGYAKEGETKKRTLETGDTNGIKKLYQ